MVPKKDKIGIMAWTFLCVLCFHTCKKSYPCLVYSMQFLDSSIHQFLLYRTLALVFHCIIYSIQTNAKLYHAV